jgi:hypothetical protein
MTEPRTIGEETAVHPKLIKIQKLLAKAEASEFPSEAEAYREQAEKLLLAHGLDVAMLDALHKGHEPEKIISKKIVLEGSYLLDRITLLHAIAGPFHCQGFRTNTKARGDTYVIYGYTSDVEHVEFLFASLSIQMQAEVARKQTPAYSTGRQMNRVSFVKGFFYGFTISVANRLRKLQKEVVAEYDGSGTELVLASRSKRVDNLMRSENRSLVTSPHHSRSALGSQHGQEAGNRANLGQTAVNSNRTRGIEK